MAAALIENPANVRGERDVSQQVSREEVLALVALTTGECRACLRQADIAALYLREAQHLQRLRHPQEVVDLHVQVLGDQRQVRFAVVGRFVHRLDQPRQQVGGNVNQRRADACPREALGLRPPPRSSPRGFAVISTYTRSTRAWKRGSTVDRGCGRSTASSLTTRPGLSRR